MDNKAKPRIDGVITPLLNDWAGVKPIAWRKNPTG